MQKFTGKTESIVEFIARGGTVTKCPAKSKARRVFHEVAEKAKMEEIDLSALPASLKIRFGVRDGEKG